MFEWSLRIVGIDCPNCGVHNSITAHHVIANLTINCSNCLTEIGHLRDERSQIKANDDSRPRPAQTTLALGNL